MNGPSVTPVARTVLTLSAESSWCPASASFPELPYFSYQAPISAIHDSRSGPCSCWPSSVIMPSIRYFISTSRLGLSGPGHPDGTLSLIPRTAVPPFRHHKAATCSMPEQELTRLLHAETFSVMCLRFHGFDSSM